MQLLVVEHVIQVLSAQRRLLKVAPPPFATGPESVQFPHDGCVLPAQPPIAMVSVRPT